MTVIINDYFFNFNFICCCDFGIYNTYLWLFCKLITISDLNHTKKKYINLYVYFYLTVIESELKKIKLYISHSLSDELNFVLLLLYEYSFYWLHDYITCAWALERISSNWLPPTAIVHRFHRLSCLISQQSLRKIILLIKNNYFINLKKVYETD